MGREQGKGESVDVGAGDGHCVSKCMIPPTIKTSDRTLR